MAPHLTPNLRTDANFSDMARSGVGQAGNGCELHRGPLPRKRTTSTLTVVQRASHVIGGQDTRRVLTEGFLNCKGVLAI